jgi:hypothetical protein
VLETVPLPIDPPQVDPPGQMQVFQFVCGKCNKLIFESRARIARSSGPVITYIRCVGCGEAEKREQRFRLISREVICQKCGRVINAFVDPETDTVRRCSVCKPAERQPQERETFCPQDRVLRNGKRGARAVMGGIRSLGGQDFVYYDDWREARNEDVEKLKDIYSPGFIEKSQRTLEDMAVRAIQKQWNLSYHSAREGKIGILRLKTTDLETPPNPTREIKQHKMGRKCSHGMWKHRNDRRKSRYCSACHPNLFRMTPRPETKPRQEKQRAKSETERSMQRLVDMDLPEEFGAIPLDPQSPISQDVQ